MNVVIGVADCHVSNDTADVLITYALGSCVAVAIYDPLSKVGGLLHFMLPEGSSDASQGGKNPYMFADSGIPLLFLEAYEKGAEKRRLRVRVAGGAQVMDPNGVFNIGKRNCVAVRKILWKAGVMVHGEEIGGTAARTVRLAIDSGRFHVRSPDGSAEREL
ncbi:MAG TPA: chemotaxis protein CheD [Bryobacteraceae bacterium]|nr:chemotaxis protein CheD [Bryobacteraceae bacterium]